MVVLRLTMFTLDTWLGIVGVLIGLVGIVLFFRSIQKRVPMYRLEPTRVLIVDKTQVSIAGLDVVHKAQGLDVQNVTAATLYFWNAGRKPIRNSDVLKPYAIQLDKSASVLDCRVLASTREVCKFPTGQIAPSENGHELALPFDIIERSDGVALQIIYAGNPGAVIRVTGVAEGANEPRLSSAASSAYDATGSLISAIAGAVLALMYLLAATFLLRTTALSFHNGSLLIVFGTTGPPPFLMGLFIGGMGLFYLGKAIVVVRKFTGFRNSAMARLTSKPSGS